MSIGRLVEEAAAALAGGDIAAATTIMARAVQQQPDDAACLACYGNVLAVAGQAQAALAVLDRALLIDSSQIPARVLRGHLRGRLQRHAEALADFEQALRLAPDNADALDGQATALAALARPEEALPVLARQLLLQPGNAELRYRRACLLALLGRHEEAAAEFERILAVAPAQAGVLRGYGIALYNLGRHREAAAVLDAALSADPRDVAALIARGLTAGQCGQHAVALKFMESALAIDPGNIDARVERGVALGLLQRPLEALACLEEARRQAPDHVEMLNALGASLALLNRTEEALQAYDRSLALKPDQPCARSDRALLYLALGDYERGFREFEVRWEIPPLSALRLDTAAPLWTGTTTLEGRTILLHHEQGYGDTLQMVRYLPQVAARGARVILRVPDALRRLLSQRPGVQRLVSEQEPLPPHDCHCPLMSLPAALGSTVTTVPAAVPYLFADPADAGHWRARLGPWTRPRIGIAWAGRRGSRIADRRDLPLEGLRPLLLRGADTGVQWVSLQQELPAGDREFPEGLREAFIAPGPLTDFADTAALMMSLDLVLSVDTAVVHLAAALGRPTWLMNRFAPCWRWRNGSPWYPAVRQFLQLAPGDWASVIEEVGTALQALTRDWRPPPAGQG